MSEKEYIEREEAIKAVNEFYHDPKVDIALRGVPTADVVEVKRGEWKIRGFDSACSECGYINEADTGTRVRCDYPYCPKCGAKMCGKHIKISERKLKNR